ncbi:hypothetical protein [Arthrobacter sp. H5]|uniref:hypothetical protein n=1 Tax=Arthrobacter sp. H5 TaxID=1267973 RepID=UPI0004B1E4E4|nr:hypothetical protein [Arthrobacter sp. H5]
MDTNSTIDQPPDTTAGSSRKKAAVVVLVAAAVLTGATLVGTAMPDPKTSEAYRSLTEEKQSVEAELAAAESSYGSLEGSYTTLRDGISDREDKVAAREAEVEEASAAVKGSEEGVKAAEAAVKKREDAVSGAEDQKAANTISDGTWTVGTDIEPGTYRSAADVGSSCYWGIYESGTNGSNIIENDIPGGGRPTVTLSAGQDFNSTRCGDWEKQ